MNTPFEIFLPISRAGFGSDRTICSFSAGWLNVRPGRDGWRNDRKIEVPGQVFDATHRVDDQVAYRIEADCSIVRACDGPEIGDVVLLLESPHRDEFDGRGGRAIGPLRNAKVRAKVELYLPDLLRGVQERLGRSLAGRGVRLVNAVQYQTSLQSLMIDYDAKLQSGVRTPVWRAVFDNGGSQDMLARLGRFDDLVRLALSDDALPAEPAMARRDVALQRLQFALKAAIRDKRHLEATKLALKAGGETAADARQQKLISANTDLATQFLEPEQMLEQVTRRLITGGDWTGSEHAYEAAFLSGASELAGDALSRLRVAYDWLIHWSRRRADKDGKSRSVGDADIAELALAELNLQGAAACAKFLRRWLPRERSFRAGRQLCSRLIDAGRFEEVADLAIAAGNDLGLLLAVTMELAVVGRLPPKAAAARMTRLVTSRHVRLREPSRSGGEILVLAAVNDVVAAAVRLRLAPKRVGVTMCHSDPWN